MHQSTHLGCRDTLLEDEGDLLGTVPSRANDECPEVRTPLDSQRNDSVKRTTGLHHRDRSHPTTMYFDSLGPPMGDSVTHRPDGPILDGMAEALPRTVRDLLIRLADVFRPGPEA